MKDTSILLIDSNLIGNKWLEKFLSDSNFKVIQGDIEYLINTGEKSRPDIILYRTNDTDSEYSRISEIRNRLNPEKNIPFVIFSPLRSPELYLLEAEKDLIYHIATPCTELYLKSKLHEILKEDNNIVNEELNSKFNLEYNGKNYQLDLSSSQFYNFLLNIIENLSHQNRLLNDILHKNCKIKYIEGSKEVLEEKYLRDDEDYEYENRLIKAFKNNEFILHYQPVISFDNGLIHGFESLIRWEKPNEGIILPDEFIPVVENTDLIIPLGNWVVDEASKQLSNWKNQFNMDLSPIININLSPRQFSDIYLCDKIHTIISKNSITPDHIAIEITENTFMDDIETVNLILLQFKAKNFLLYMDDFGTGYSSLSYLLYYPFDIIKIDKSFVQWMHIDDKSEEIVRSTILLAHNLKKKVVAEGVESAEHYKLLKKLGCDYGQGYYFSPPLDSDSAGDYISRNPIISRKII